MVKFTADCCGWKFFTAEREREREWEIERERERERIAKQKNKLSNVKITSRLNANDDDTIYFQLATVSSCQHWADCLKVSTFLFPLYLLRAFSGCIFVFGWFFSLAFDQISICAISMCWILHCTENKNEAIYLIVKCARVKINVFNEFHNHGHKSPIANKVYHQRQCKEEKKSAHEPTNQPTRRESNECDIKASLSSVQK